MSGKKTDNTEKVEKEPADSAFEQVLAEISPSARRQEQEAKIPEPAKPGSAPASRDSLLGMAREEADEAAGEKTVETPKKEEPEVPEQEEVKEKISQAPEAEAKKEPAKEAPSEVPQGPRPEGVGDRMPVPKPGGLPPQDMQERLNKAVDAIHKDEEATSINLQKIEEGMSRMTS